MRPIVLRLGAAQCTGKSTVLSLINSGTSQLLCDVLDVPGPVCQSVPRSLITARERNGTLENEWAHGLLSEHGCQTLAIEEELIGNLYTATFSDFEVRNVVLVLPYFLWRARRDFRASRGGDLRIDWVRDGSREAYAKYAAMMVRDNPRDTVFVDVSDYPLTVIPRSEVYGRMVENDCGEYEYEPEFTTGDSGYRPDYHRAIYTPKKVYGHGYHLEDILRRADETLPDDMTGMSVLDIGAAEGAFTFASVARGAANVTSFEIDANRVKTIKGVRDEIRAPVTTVCANIHQTPPPNLVCGGGGRYDLTLFLNVIHHLRDPEDKLRKVLSVSNKVICETRTEDGDGATIGKPPHQSFSPHWMRAIGEDCGFDLTVREPAINSVDYRKMFVFERKAQ